MSFLKIVELREQIKNLSEEIDTYVLSDASVTEASEGLLQLNLAKRDIATVYDTLTHFVALKLGDETEISLGEGALIEKKTAYDRKAWEHKKLGSAVVDKLVKMSIDMDTGEVIKTPSEIAIQLLDFCAPSYWRVKELSSIGINADMYCETGQLKTTIIVRKGENQ